MGETNYIAVSGGFDPVHAGHIAYLEAASRFSKVLVFLNTDEWLMKKKGFVFMTWEERAIILKSIKYVHRIIKASDFDGTVRENLKNCRLPIEYFGNGGDRGKDNTPEKVICKTMGIKMIYGLGGEKRQSSSDLVKNVQENTKVVGKLC